MKPVNPKLAHNRTPPKVTTATRLKEISKSTTKELVQWLSEHIPFVQNIELLRKKTLFSGIPIENKLQRNGRIIQNVPQCGTVYSLLHDGQKILEEAKENIKHLFFTLELPQNISVETRLAMLWIATGLLIYYGLTKPGDMYMYKQLYGIGIKNIHSSDDPNE